MNDFDTLLVKNIEQFIKKYFRNRLHKGVLFAVLLVSSTFLIYNFIEFFAFLPTWARMTMFYSFLTMFLLVLVFYIVIPIIKLVRYHKSMSIKEAAKIIGAHFPDQVNDRLLNTLQLRDSLQQSKKDDELLLAAIQQKSEALSVLSFSSAVTNKENLRFLKYSSIPVGILLLLLLFFPSIVKQPSQRIITYNETYSKPLPFTVDILSDRLEVLQNEDYIIEIEVTGDEIPEKFYIQSNGTRYEMLAESLNIRTHTFKRVGATLDFVISGGEYKSGLLTLVVRPKPLLLSYRANVVFPSYMDRKTETFKDMTYLSLPVGSVIEWSFYTKDTERILIQVDSSGKEIDISEGLAEFTFQLLKQQIVTVVPLNIYSSNREGVSIQMDVIGDDFPVIQATQLKEEIIQKQNYFTGIISDDYGFSNLLLHTQVFDQDKEAAIKTIKTELPFNSKELRQEFFYSFNTDSIGALPGQKVTIQFQVTDNDRISGPKSSLSALFSFELTSVEALDSLAGQKEDELTDRLESALKEAAELKDEAAAMNKKMMLKKDLDWNDKQQLKQLLEKQKNLESEIQDITQEREKLNEFNRDHDLMNERMLEKQARIDDLLEKVIPEDIRQMMEELQKMMEEMNKEQLSEMLKKMEMSNEDMEKMLDRNLSLLQQLQVEKEMNKLIDDLKKLSDELKENADKTTNSDEKKEQLSSKLDEIQKKFDKEMNKLDSLRNQNSGLEEPFELIETKEVEKEISEEMESGKQQLEQNKKKQSGNSQKSAAEKMEELSKQLDLMMQQSEEEQTAEDAASLRFLLENLMRVSMSQESLMRNLSQLKRDDPSYADLMKQQGTITESFKVIEDSLVALGKRQPMIESFVFTEVSTIKRKIEEAQQSMKDRFTPNAVSAQQFSMMSMNNLALMLAEALKNMQESMGMPSPQQGKGKGKGKNPSPGKGLQNMREMQESLGKQLKEAMEGKQGKGKGQGKGLSEEMARMAAQQEALRNELKRMIDDLKSEGQTGDGGLNKVLEEMEKFEEGLVNKRLNQQLLEMNNEIVVRLLESEKAQKERDKEERRESEEFKGKNLSNPEEIPEYNRMLERQKETLRTNPIDLQPFYKRLVNDYFMKSNK